MPRLDEPTNAPDETVSQVLTGRNEIVGALSTCRQRSCTAGYWN
jgi:hypothetical protein